MTCSLFQKPSEPSKEGFSSTFQVNNLVFHSNLSGQSNQKFNCCLFFATQLWWHSTTFLPKSDAIFLNAEVLKSFANATCSTYLHYCEYWRGKKRNLHWKRLPVAKNGFTSLIWRPIFAAKVYFTTKDFHFAMPNHDLLFSATAYTKYPEPIKNQTL